jgi:TRAP-type C4-dicarboxylate transport system permease large subunit
MGPSLLQIALFAGYTFYVTLVRPNGPAARAAHPFGMPLLIKCAWGIIPAGILIFLVLGTIMMGLATPTEAGAMGTIGAIVLAVVRNAPLTKFDKWFFAAGCAAAIAGLLIGLVAFKSIPFKIAFTIMFASIIWLCWRAWQVKDLRELDRAGPSRRPCASPPWWPSSWSARPASRSPSRASTATSGSST